MTSISPLLRHRLQRATVAVCVVASLCSLPLRTVQAQNTLPSLGDTVSQDFDVGAERKLGDRIMRDIRRDPDYLDDPVMLEYVRSIWNPLVDASRRLGNVSPDIDSRYAWEPFLVRDREVNAFALPGGYVGINLGLIAMTSTRDELASVMAHEMSHVTQRHIARGMANAKQQSIIGIAAMVVGALAAAKAPTTDGGSALMAGGQAYAIQGQLNFSREVEREADRVGFGVLTNAGFAPSGMASMFEKLEQASHLNDSNSYPYLRSHPITSERIGDARARLGAVSGTLPVRPVDAEHLLIAARARVLMDSRVDALRRWQALDSDRASNATASDKIVNAASSAMASSQLREWARADAAFATARTLVAATPAPHKASDRLLAMMTAQSMIERGDAARAAEQLKPYAADGSRPVMLLQAQMALAGSAPDPLAVTRSADTLNLWVTQHPTDALAWSVLGQSWERLGQKLRAVRADAESHAALGDLSGAIDRLRAGQRMARGPGVAPSEFIEASVIDARLRDVEIANKKIEAEEKKG